jgi:hypothetical protein
MGRWAQQRKRGGHLGMDAGLPAGPLLNLWDGEVIEGVPFVIWATDGVFPYSHWRSRWRVPAVSMLWTLSVDPVQDTVSTMSQQSPLEALPGQQQDVELIYCDAAGNPKSDWSGFASVVP